MKKVREAKAIVVGGHTIDDSELKFGLSVTGIAHPAKILTNAAAKAGEAVILAKPLGTGLITTAMKKGGIGERQGAEAIRSMRQLNAAAASILAKHQVKCATDVTGFGLIGHALEIAKASKICISLETTRIPILAAARRLSSDEKYLTRANRTNRENIGKYVVFSQAIDEPMKRVVFDPQTSGGLLFTIKAQKAGTVISDLRTAGYKYAAVIGHTEKGRASIELA